MPRTRPKDKILGKAQKARTKATIGADQIKDELLRRLLGERGIEVKPPSEMQPMNLREFVEWAWPLVEPAVPLKWNRAMEAVCLHLEAASRREITRLIINIPPGSSKSKLVNVYWLAWHWGEFGAHEKFLCTSHNMALSTRDSVTMRSLIESDTYRARYPHVILSADQNQKLKYQNTEGGHRVCVGLLNATGERADIEVIDDPNNIEEAESKAARDAANDAVNGALATRATDEDTFVRVIVQQRVAEEDVTGYILKHNPAAWVHLNLPEKFEVDRKCFTRIGWEDWRTEDGELLMPERRSLAALADLEKTLGPYKWAGQYQQRPAPEGGGILKRQWWKFHAPEDMIRSGVLRDRYAKLPDGTNQMIPTVATPQMFDQQTQHWDLTFKDTKDSDYVVGMAWGTLGQGRYLLEMVRQKADFVTSKALVMSLSNAYPLAYVKTVEEKANGAALLNDMQGSIPGLIPWNPDAYGPKIARIHAVTPLIAGGDTFIPHPDWKPWVESQFWPECENFPNAANDDVPDCMAQALLYLRVISGLHFD